MTGIVMGIDPSVTCLGLVVTDGNGVIDRKAISFPSERGFKRMHLIAQGVSNLVDEHNPDLIVLEHYAFSSKTLSVSVSIGAIIRYNLFLKSRIWLEVPPTTLKKWATGKGNAKKPDMAKAMQDKWRFDSKSNDIVDAFALAKLGEQVLTVGILSTMKGVTYGQ